MDNQKQQSFESKAEKGNKTFNKFCEQQAWCRVNKFSTDKFATWDVSFRNKREEIVGEIKLRNKMYPTYLLEVEKFNALMLVKNQMKRFKNKDVRIEYINILPNNFTYIWDITNLRLEDYTIEQRWLQKNDYDETLVLKDVIYLTHEWAEKYETEQELSIFKQENN